MTTVTSTEFQNNFGKYLKLAQLGEEIIIYRNGTAAARLVSETKSITYLTDSLKGVLKNDVDEKDVKAEIAAEQRSKYENLN